MKPSALSSDLVTALKRLKLGRIVETLPDRLVLADKQDMTFDDLLLLVLTDEITRRDNAATDIRANQAGLDPAMRLDLWDKTAKVSFDKRMLAELVSLRFLEAHKHVAVLGRTPGSVEPGHAAADDEESGPDAFGHILGS